MIRIGNILIDPDQICSINREPNRATNDAERGIHTICIVFKNGIVKNFYSNMIGMDYSEFIDEVFNQARKSRDRDLALMTACTSK